MTSKTESRPPLVDSLNRPFFLWSMPFIFLYFGLPIIGKVFGASALEVGGLFSVLTGTTLLLRPLVGWCLDRFNRKPFLIIAMVIYAISMLLFAFADSVTSLYVARLIQGVGSALLWTTANTIVADLTQSSERGKTLGRISEVTNQGGMVGIFLASALMIFLSEEWGWKLSFLLFSLFTFIAAWLVYRRVPSTRGVIREKTLKIQLSPKLYFLFVVVFLTGVPEAMLSPIYLTYLQDKFTTSTWVLALAFFPAGLVTAFLSSWLGSLSDRFGRIPMIAIGLAGTGLISLALPYLPSILWLGILYTLNAVLWGVSEPAETALVAELTGSERLGMGYGLYDLVENLGFTVGPLAGGLLYDTLGREMPFLLNGLILLICSGLVLIFMRSKTQAVSE